MFEVMGLYILLKPLILFHLQLKFTCIPDNSDIAHSNKLTFYFLMGNARTALYKKIIFVGFQC